MLVPIVCITYLSEVFAVDSHSRRKTTSSRYFGRQFFVGEKNPKISKEFVRAIHYLPFGKVRLSSVR